MVKNLAAVIKQRLHQIGNGNYIIAIGKNVTLPKDPLPAGPLMVIC